MREKAKIMRYKVEIMEIESQNYETISFSYFGCQDLDES